MGTEQRIKGQEAEIRILQNGKQVAALTDIKDFEVGFLLEKLDEGYIGEKTNRKDEVYKGVRGKLTVHFENGDGLDFVDSIVQRAKRAPGTRGMRINVNGILNFPDGSQKAIYIPNCFFGEVPMTAGSRTDYISKTFEFESSDYDLGE